MDRIIVYPAEVAQSSTDNLTDSKNAYIAISKLAQIITGTTTYINNFPCNPTSPASLSVVVGGGEVYSYQPIDSTAYGGIPADASNFIMKQGITLSSTTLALTAPTNTGNSKNYLIQISFSEVDNASSQRTFVNSETLQNYTETVSNSRINTCIISTKVGAEAPTGTQLTPSPDANFVGAWIVTVAYGQTQINAGNITLYPNAPFLRTIIDSLPTYSEKLSLDNAPNPINAANPVVDMDTFFASQNIAQTQNNIIDPDITIDILPISILNSNKTKLITIPSIISKKINIAWEEGLIGGGRFSGVTLSPNTWYNVFVIMKADGTVGAGFDLGSSEVPANLPAGYAYYKLVCSVKTDGSSHIIKYTQRGNKFIWHEGVVDVFNTGTLTPQTSNVSCPKSRDVKAFFALALDAEVGEYTAMGLTNNYYYGGFEAVGSASSVSAIAISRNTCEMLIVLGTITHFYETEAPSLYQIQTLGWEELW